MTDFIDMDALFQTYTENVSGKKATYVLPKTLLDKQAYSEIDTSQDVEDIIAKHANLNNLFTRDGDDVMPLGDDIPTETDGMPMDEMTDIAAPEGIEPDTDESDTEFSPALAAKVLDLATKLDSAGFVRWAQELDGAVADFVGQPLATTEDQQKEQLAGQLSTLVAASLEGKHWLLAHAKQNLDDKLKEAIADPTKMKSFASAYQEMMDTLGKVPDLKEHHERMIMAWPTVQNLAKQGK